VMPTRERLTTVVGRRAWTSLPRMVLGWLIPTAKTSQVALWDKSHEPVYTGRRLDASDHWPDWLSPSRRPRDSQLDRDHRPAPVVGVFVKGARG
jgi:hypothetical protein